MTARRFLARAAIWFSRLGVGRIPGARGAWAFANRILLDRSVRPIPTRDGALWVHPDDQVVAVHLEAYGIWEPDETEILRERIRPGNLVLDVGANIGYFTLLASRRIGPSGRVVAFEPEPGNVAILHKNVETNRLGNVTVVAACVTERRGTVTLNVDAHNRGAHSLSAGALCDAGGVVTVPSVPLDDYVDVAGNATGVFVKMDIQGAEGLALRGAPRFLDRPDISILMEFWPHSLRAMGTPPEDVLSDLVSRGFVLRPVLAGGGLGPVTDPGDLLRQLDGRAADAFVDILLEKA